MVKTFLILIVGFALTAAALMVTSFYLKEFGGYSSSLTLVLDQDKMTFKLNPKESALKIKELGLDSERIKTVNLTVSPETAKLAGFLNQKPIDFEIKDRIIKFRRLAPLDGGFLLSYFKIKKSEDSEAGIFPESTFLYVKKSLGLEKMLSFPGLEILTKSPNPVTFGVFPVGKDMGFAFVQKIKEGQDLTRDFEQLNLVPQTEEERTDALGIGFSKNLVNEVEVKMLTMPNLALVPTFGQLADTLIIASSPESFAKIIDVSKSKENSLSTQPDFHKLTTKFKEPFLDLAYLDLKSIREMGLERIKDSAKEYFKIQYSEEITGAINWLLQNNKFIASWDGSGLKGELHHD